MDRSQQIAELHAEYVRLTGFKISLAGREWCWFEWIKRDLTLKDLRALVAETRRKIGRGELTTASLAFRNLVGQVDYAEENAAELRARARVGPPMNPAKASILRQTGRPSTLNAQPSPEAQSGGAIAQRLMSDPAAAAKALADLQALKNRL